MIDGGEFAEYSFLGPLGGGMLRLREAIAAVVSLVLVLSPVWGASSSTALGTLVYAERAHVGAAPASVGATIFDGDRLSTEPSGSLQWRSRTARLLLNSSSYATLSDDSGTAVATLTSGTATFSTSTAGAFALHFGKAVISPKSDEPTIGQVTAINPKELVVKCTRGTLSISVEDDSRIIPEGMAYRIVLDPYAEPQPRAASSPRPQGPPIKAGRSKFIWYAIAITAGVTAFALSEVLESPDRP
jgi:hypothetical protein